jgi:hypothetical protein
MNTIVIIARNEGEWVRKTVENYHLHMPDCEIIGVDDGGYNDWPQGVKVINTEGAIGVGRCRLLGHRIYALPNLVFTHLFKEKFNYSLKYSEQNYNRILLNYWMFDYRVNVSEEEENYKKFIDSRRLLSGDQLIEKMDIINYKYHDANVQN